MRKLKHRWSVAVAAAFVVFVASAYCVPWQAAESVHLTMGNPSEATKDEGQPENFLMVKPQYALSYNRKTATPNWVSWHLTKEDLGDEDRADDFRADDALPGDWFRVTHKSFVGSGFDRGHMCPSGDRTKNEPNNSATFLMTNMVPQAPRNNRRPWRDLEMYCRELVLKGNRELYIICGPEGKGGTGKKGLRKTLTDAETDEKINVPQFTWKVIMVLRRGNNDLSRVNAETRLIAVIMPNAQTIDLDWTEQRVSVDEVEELTEFDFFSKVPVAIQKAIEKDVDDVEIE